MKKFFLISFFFFLLAATVYAETNTTNLPYIPLEPFPGVPSAAYSQPGQFGSLFNAIFILLISLGSLLAVVTLVISGIVYMTSEATGKKDEARKRIQNSIYGLLILVGSYLILSTINPDLLRLNFNPGQITQTPVTSPQPQNANLTNATQADINDCERPGGQSSGKRLYPLATGGFECR